MLKAYRVESRFRLSECDARLPNGRRYETHNGSEPSGGRLSPETSGILSRRASTRLASEVTLSAFATVVDASCCLGLGNHLFQGNLNSWAAGRYAAGRRAQHHRLKSSSQAGRRHTPPQNPLLPRASAGRPILQRLIVNCGSASPTVFTSSPFSECRKTSCISLTFTPLQSSIHLVLSFINGSFRSTQPCSISICA